MKPLNKLEKEMFKVITGWRYETAIRIWKPDRPPGITICELEARRAAKVAVDLAKRAIFFVPKNANDGLFDRYKQFLKSEGIETEN